MSRENVLENSVIYTGKIVTLEKATVQLDNGATALREKVVHLGGVGVLPVDEEGFCYLVRQYRFGAGETLLEIPAGKLENLETPLDCGLRELREEVGFLAKKMEYLGYFYPTPAYCSEKIHLFLGLSLVPVPQQLQEDEYLEVLKMPLWEAISLARRGEILDAKTVVALLRCQDFMSNFPGKNRFV